MRVLVLFAIMLFSFKGFSQSYAFFAIANGSTVLSEKSGSVIFTDSTISVNADGSTEKPVVWKVTSKDGSVYKYQSGEFSIVEEKGKAGGKKFNTVIYMTMPNGLGGTYTLQYLCLIKKP